MPAEDARTEAARRAQMREGFEMRGRSLLGVAALTIAMSLLATACGGGADSPSGGTETGNNAPPSADSPADLDALRQAAEEAYGSEPWWEHVTEWREITVLGAPTVVVITDYDSNSEEADEARNEIASRIVDLEPQFAHNVDARAWSQVGERRTLVQLSAASSGGTPMSEQFDLPAAPQTVEEFSAWMETVYGPGGGETLGDDETWYDSITGYAFEIPEGMTEALLVVRTTMTPDDVDAEDMQFYRLQRALQATGSPLLEFYAVLGADDRLLVASSGGASEPGAGGPQY